MGKWQKLVGKEELVQHLSMDENDGTCSASGSKNKKSADKKRKRNEVW